MCDTVFAKIVCVFGLALCFPSTLSLFVACQAMYNYKRTYIASMRQVYIYVLLVYRFYVVFHQGHIQCAVYEPMKKSSTQLGKSTMTKLKPAIGM